MIRILQLAQLELDDAFVYYENQLTGLGYEHIEEFEKAIKRISKFPEAWHPFSKNTRRCQLRRFPYAIVYNLSDNEILIVAFAHLHRKPFYWASRF